MKIKLSQSDWEEIGKAAGWLKTAQQDPEHTYNMGDSHYDDFEEVGPKYPAKMRYWLRLTDGTHVRKGRFEVSSEDEVLKQLNNELKGRPCGPDGPVSEVIKSEDDYGWTHTHEAKNADGITCGFIEVTK